MDHNLALVNQPIKRYRIETGDVSVATVFLVGCGGTGSFAALHLARLAYVAKEKGQAINLVFIDPDTVEQKNIGRQNFCPGEVGQLKALTLARRFSHAFGLKIIALTDRFDPKQVIEYRPYSSQLNLIAGCVDTPAARRSIAEAAFWDGRTWWLDAGNDEHGGQVLLGNIPFPNFKGKDPQPVIDPLGYCTGLPLPSVQEPGLIAEPEPGPALPVNGSQANGHGPALSCADLMALEAQSLMINQSMAGWLATYAYRLLLGHDLDLCATYIDLKGGSVGSVAITGEPEVLKKVKKKPRRREVFEDRLWLPEELLLIFEERACPECAGDVVEGRDTVDPNPFAEEIDILFCPHCQWQMTLAGLQEWLAVAAEENEAVAAAVVAARRQRAR